MKTIYVCTRCGSAKIHQDATYYPNKDKYVLDDLTICNYCDNITSEGLKKVEVPDDFNIDRDLFDLNTLARCDK
jgi:hypothetical protein